jgi:hypothetical protein
MWTNSSSARRSNVLDNITSIELDIAKRELGDMSIRYVVTMLLGYG